HAPLLAGPERVVQAVVLGWADLAVPLGFDRLGPVGGLGGRPPGVGVDAALDERPAVGAVGPVAHYVAPPVLAAGLARGRARCPSPPPSREGRVGPGPAIAPRRVPGLDVWGLPRPHPPA